MNKKLLIALSAVSLILVVSFCSFLRAPHVDTLYRIYTPLKIYSSAYDTSDYQTKGILRIGWGCEVCVSLAFRQNGTGDNIPEKSAGLQEDEQIVLDVFWDALLPDGTVVEPNSVSAKGVATFAMPYEMTGVMTIRANVNNTIVDEFEVIVVDHYIKGDLIRGMTYSCTVPYYIKKNGKIGKGWFRDEGNWYYSDSDGVMQFGWQYLNYNGIDNWYFFDRDGKMLTGWQRIGNSWYFFKSDGSMAANEWAGGYWLSANGSWKYHYKGKWKYNKIGWWFEDTSGWYPRNTTVKINGVLYSFNSRGYLVE